MESKARVRYSHVVNQLKNTLVTVSNGETIYFGIARCRLNADTATKKEGKRLAEFRATIAATVAGVYKVDGSLAIHKSGVFGQVNVVEVIKLLEYFDHIDEVSAHNLHGK
jgi:hypothetical protein